MRRITAKKSLMATLSGKQPNYILTSIPNERRSTRLAEMDLEYGDQLTHLKQVIKNAHSRFVNHSPHNQSL